MSEVRLFCDLLVQQVVNVKQETQSDQPDMQVRVIRAAALIANA